MFQWCFSRLREFFFLLRLSQRYKNGKFLRNDNEKYCLYESYILFLWPPNVHIILGMGKHFTGALTNQGEKCKDSKFASNKNPRYISCIKTSNYFLNLISQLTTNHKFCIFQKNRWIHESQNYTETVVHVIFYSTNATCNTVQFSARFRMCYWFFNLNSIWNDYIMLWLCISCCIYKSTL